jgi:hypothetical protein
MKTSRIGWIVGLNLNGTRTYRLIIADTREAARRCAEGLGGTVARIEPASQNGADGLLTERLLPHAIHA